MRKPDLNFFRNKKSLLRILFLGCAVLGAWELAGSPAARITALVMKAGPILKSTEAATIGIIGGADGPTAVFVTGIQPFWRAYFLPAAMLVIGILGYFRTRKP